MYKKLLGQTAIYGLSNVLVRVFPFVLTPILTHLFGAVSFAPFVDFYSAAGIISVFLTHGMETSVFNFITKEKDKNIVYSTALVSVLGISLFLLGFGLFFRQCLANAFQQPEMTLFVSWFLVFLSLDAITAIPFVKMRIEEKAIKYGSLKIINGVLNFVLVLLFLWFIPLIIEKEWAGSGFLSKIYNPTLGVGYTFLANLLASLFTFAFIIPDLFKIGFKFDVLLWKKMMPYALPIMIAGFGAIINESLDKQFLKYLLPKEIADHTIGIYGAVYKISTFLILFRQAYLLGIEPFFFANADKANAPKMYAKLMTYFVMVNAVILLFLVANMDLMKFYIPRKEYWEGFDVVPIILIAAVFLGIYLNLSIWYKLTNKTYIGAVISVVGAFITIVINFAFIPAYGYWASTWATLISYASMMAISYHYGKKSYPIPYNMRKISFYLITSILFSILSYYVFGHNLFVGNFFFVLYIAMLYKIEEKNFRIMFHKK